MYQVTRMGHVVGQFETLEAAKDAPAGIDCAGWVTWWTSARTGYWYGDGKFQAEWRIVEMGGA